MLNGLKKYWLPAFLGGLVFVCQGSYARETYTVIGKISCQDWSEDWKKSKDKEKMYEWISFSVNKSWLLGFASGINFLAKEDLLEQLDSKLIVDWTTKYCEENPNKDVVEAVGDLLVKTKKIAEQERSDRRTKKR